MKRTVECLAVVAACFVLAGCPGTGNVVTGPTADAGADITTTVGEPVMLDGSGSANAVTYTWVKTSGPEVTIINSDERQATVVPPEAGTYVFRLGVADDTGAADFDSVTVTVTGGSDGGNTNDNGVDNSNTNTNDNDTGNANDNDVGNGNDNDVDNVNDNDVENANDNDVDNANDNDMDNDNANDNDGGNTNDNDVLVENTDPIAVAGPDQSVFVGDPVQLDASGSWDPDGDSLDFAWSRFSGPDATIANADTAEAMFTPQEAGTYVLQVTVTDDFGGWDADTVAITATEPTYVALDLISFLGDVPGGVDPATLSIGGGSVTFSGGIARIATGAETRLTAGFVDSWAWFVDTGSDSTVTFSGLEVRSVKLYFADLGAPGGTLTALSASGQVLGTVNSYTAAVSNDTAAIFTIESSGVSIDRLVIDVPTGVTVALDEMILTVVE